MMADNYYNPNMPYLQYTPEAEEPAKEQEYSAWSPGVPSDDNVNAQSLPYSAAYGQDNGFNPYAAVDYPQEPYYPAAYPYAPQPDYSQNAPQSNYYGGYAPMQPAAPVMPSATSPYAQPYVSPIDYRGYAPASEAEPTAPYAPAFNGGAYQPAAPAQYDYTPYGSYQSAVQPNTYAPYAEPQVSAPFTAPEAQAPQSSGYAVNPLAPNFNYPVEQQQSPQVSAPFSVPEPETPQTSGYAVNPLAPNFNYPVEQQQSPQASAPFTAPVAQAPQTTAPIQGSEPAPYVPHFEENSFTRKYSMPSFEEYDVRSFTNAETTVQTEALANEKPSVPLNEPSSTAFETPSNYNETPKAEYMPTAFEEPAAVNTPAPSAFEEPTAENTTVASSFEEPAELKASREDSVIPDAFVPFEAPVTATKTEDIFSSLVTPPIYSEPQTTATEETTPIAEAIEDIEEEPKNIEQPPIFSDFDTSFGEQPAAFEQINFDGFPTQAEATETQNAVTNELSDEQADFINEVAEAPAEEPNVPKQISEFVEADLSQVEPQQPTANESAAKETPAVDFPQFASFGAVITDTATQNDFPELTGAFAQSEEEASVSTEFEFKEEPSNENDNLTEFEFNGETSSENESLPAFEFSDEPALVTEDEAAGAGETLSGAIERIAAQHETPQNTEEIYKIAEEMSRSVLANSYNRVFNENNLAPSKKEFCLKASGISADYYLLKSGGQPYLMYDNVDITVHTSSCTALISDVKLASYALSKAIGELADYRSEEIELSETEDGYDHDVLYIGNDSMLPTEFTVMDYLLFALGNIDLAGDNEEYDNEDMLNILLNQIGISDWADIGTKELSHNKRILLLALSAALNPYVSCIIINDPKFNITHTDDMLARRVFAKLMSEGKGVLLSSCSEHLMATVANRVIAIRSGRVVFDGSYKQFLDRFCLGIMSFTSSKPDETVEFFVQHHPNVSALTNGNLVYLLKKHEGDIDLDLLLKDALRNGTDHRSIVLDEKSFEIASKEVLRGI